MKAACWAALVEFDLLVKTLLGCTDCTVIVKRPGGSIPRSVFWVFIGSWLGFGISDYCVSMGWLLSR